MPVAVGFWVGAACAAGVVVVAGTAAAKVAKGVGWDSL